MRHGTKRDNGSTPQQRKAATKRSATAANWLSEHHFADVVAAALCRRARRDNGSCLDRARRLQSERLQFRRTKSERSRLGMANLQASGTNPRERDSLLT